ncbi:unnamed protein product [Linum trigynum]|uniref:ALOG domain-containing protein n=1 Tax=Linum trigynum TaxID=586398 RepID=A0AAV2FWQ3_9ROSI
MYPVVAAGAHVLEFLRYLNQLGMSKVHTPICPFYGHPTPPAPCPCPLRQAWCSRHQALPQGGARSPVQNQGSQLREEEAQASPAAEAAPTSSAAATPPPRKPYSCDGNISFCFLLIHLVQLSAKCLVIYITTTNNVGTNKNINHMEKIR